MPVCIDWWLAKGSPTAMLCELCTDCPVPQRDAMAHGCGIRALISFECDVWILHHPSKCLYEVRVPTNTDISSSSTQQFLKRFVCCMWRGYGLSRMMSNNDIGAHLFEINSVFALRHLLSQLGTAAQTQTRKKRQKSQREIDQWHLNRNLKNELFLFWPLLNTDAEFSIFDLLHFPFVDSFRFVFFESVRSFSWLKFSLFPLSRRLQHRQRAWHRHHRCVCTRHMLSKLQCATQNMEIRSIWHVVFRSNWYVSSAYTQSTLETCSAQLFAQIKHIILHMNEERGVTDSSVNTFWHFHPLLACRLFIRNENIFLHHSETESLRKRFVSMPRSTSLLL